MPVGTGLIVPDMTSESDRASGSFVSVPRIFSLKKAVLLRPSVMLASLTELW